MSKRNVPWLLGCCCWKGLWAFCLITQTRGGWRKALNGWADRRADGWTKNGQKDRRMLHVGFRIVFRYRNDNFECPFACEWKNKAIGTFFRLRRTKRQLWTAFPAPTYYEIWSSSLFLVLLDGRMDAFRFNEPKKLLRQFPEDYSSTLQHVTRRHFDNSWTFQRKIKDENWIIYD